MFSCVFVARRCVWTSCHTTSSCTQKASPLNASAGVLAGGKSFHTLSHSLQCGRCAASSSLCWILYDKQVRNVRVLLFVSSADEGSKRVPLGLTHLPPDSLQLGQVHATLRSLLPSWPIWSSSSTILPRRWDRSLVFRVESVLSCQSPESGSSFIWMSGIISMWLWVDTPLCILELKQPLYLQGSLLLHLGQLSWQLLSAGWGSVLYWCWLE